VRNELGYPPSLKLGDDALHQRHADRRAMLHSTAASLPLTIMAPETVAGKNLYAVTTGTGSA
jgi:hypothetical protein